MTALHMIWACARNGVIGKDGQMPWHLQEDLAHFKSTTLGCPVIMGRKTWDALPPKFRPLPDRLNIVLTRDAVWAPDAQTPSPIIAHSLDAAVQACGHAPVAWVMGGAQIYAQALPLASVAVVTEIETDADGDAFAPVLGSQWQEVTRQRHSSRTGLAFSFIRYIRMG
jgi:dihydrofolate reductase